MLLRITDGTTTVTIHDDSSSPTTPLLGAQYIPLPGSGMYATETAQVVWSGAVSTLRSVTNDIERLFAQASDRHADAETFVEYRPTNSGDIYRSPLTSDSQLVWPDDRLRRQMSATNATGEFALVLARENYWEGPETQLATGTIKNGTTSPYNVLSLTAPAGALPTPLTVSVINASGASISPTDYYLNVDAYVGMTTNQHLLTGPTTVGLADGRVYLFAVSSTVLGKWLGRDAHLTLALSSSFTGYVYAAVYTTLGGVYAEVYRGSERYINGRSLIDLGSVPLPPGGRANTNVAVAAGVYDTATLSTSFMQIAPAENALKLHQIGYITANNTGVYEDGREQEAWAGTSSTRYEIIRRSGGPLLAYPDRTNRLHVLFDEGSNVVERSMTVTATARPRRTSL